MAFAVRRDAPSVAPARFEYTLEDGRGGGRGEKKKNRSARAKTVIVQSSGDGEQSKGFPRPLSLNLQIFAEKGHGKIKKKKFITFIVFNDNLSTSGPV